MDDEDLSSAMSNEKNDCSPMRDLVGGCNPMEIQTGASYLTEDDDVWLAEYNEGDDNDSSDSSSVSLFD